MISSPKPKNCYLNFLMRNSLTKARANESLNETLDMIMAIVLRQFWMIVLNFASILTTAS